MGFEPDIVSGWVGDYIFNIPISTFYGRFWHFYCQTFRGIPIFW